MSSIRNSMPSAVNKISFKTWFLKAVEKDNRLKMHHYDALLAYFKSMGLGEISSISMYEKALRLYFGK